jgi:internalin A
LADTPDLFGINMTEGEEISDLFPLAKRYNIKYLNLSGCKKISDITPLEKLASLVFLDLSGCNLITDLSPLSGLKSLGQLEMMDWEKFPDEPIPELPALHSLDVSGGKMKNLEMVVNQWFLQNLNASNCNNLTDLSALEKLTYLNALKLESCEKLANIAPLEKLEHLSYLDLKDCDNVFYILPLMKIRNLQVVYLSSEKKYHFSDIEKICQSLPLCKVFVQTQTADEKVQEKTKDQANAAT